MNYISTFLNLSTLATNCFPFYEKIFSRRIPDNKILLVEQIFEPFSQFYHALRNVRVEIFRAFNSDYMLMFVVLLE